MTDQSDGVGLLVDIDPVMSSFTSVQGSVGSSLAEMSDSLTSSLATRYYSTSRFISEDDPFGCDLRALSTREPTGKQCLNNNPNTGLLVQISDSESSGTSVSKSLSQYASGISMSVSQYPSIASNGSVSGTSVLFGNLSHISGPGNRLSCTQDSRFSLDIPITDADEVFNSIAENKDGAPDWDRLLNEAQYLALSLKDDKSKTLQTPANKLKKQATRTRLLNFSPGEGLESPLQDMRADFLVQNTPEKSPKMETDLLVDIGDSPKKDPSRKMTFNEQPEKPDVVDLLDVQNELPLLKDVQLLNINFDGAIDIKTKVNGVFENQNFLEFSPKCSQVNSIPDSSKNPSIKNSPLSKSPKSSLVLSPTNKTPSIEVEGKKQKKNLSTIKENVPPMRITPRMRHQFLKKPQRSPLAANNSSKPNLAKSNAANSAKIPNKTSAKTLEETSAKSANNSAEAVIKETPSKVKTSNARRTSMTTPQSKGITPRRPLISPLTKPMKPRTQSSPLATPLSSSNEPNSRQGPVMKGSLLNRKTGLSVPSKVAGITPMSKFKGALMSKVPGITPMSKPSSIPNTSNLSRVTPVRAATSLKKPSLNSSVDGSGLIKPGTSSLVKPGVAKPSSTLSSLGRSRTSLNFNQDKPSLSLARPTLNTSAATKSSTDTYMINPTLPRPSINNSMSRPQGLPRPLTSMPRPQMSRPGSKNTTPAASPRVGGLPLVSSTPAVPRPRPLARALPSPIGVKRRTAQ